MNRCLLSGKNLLSIVVVFQFIHLGFPQTIRGYLTDATDKSPVKFADIIVLDHAITVSTTKNGFYEIKGLKAENWYKVRVQHPAFEKEEREVYVKYDEPAKLNICLKQKLLQSDNEWIKASRPIQDEVFESAKSIAIYNKRQLAQNAPVNSLEATQGLSGLWASQTTPGMGAPIIRGLSGGHNLILLDGVRMNTSLLGVRPSSYIAVIDPSAISRIELIRSSGAAPYGEGAMGGVLQFFGETPQYSAKGLNVNGSIQSRYLSSGMEWGGRTQIQLSSPRIALLGGVSYSDFGNVITGGHNNKLIPTGFQRRNSDIKARFLFAARHQLTISHKYSRLDNLPHYEQIIFKGFERFQSDPLSHQLTFVRWESYYKHPLIKKIKVTGSHQRLKEDRSIFASESDVIRAENDELDTWGASLEVHSQPLSSWNIVSGIDYYKDDIESETYLRDINGQSLGIGNSKFPNGAQANNLSLFSLHTFDILKLRLSVGGRAHLYHLGYEDKTFGKIELSPKALSSNFSALYPLSRHYHMVASFNSGYRMPNFHDLGYLGVFSDGIEVPNEMLEREKSLTTEIGIKAKTDKYTGSVMLYRTRMSDLLQRVYGFYQSRSYYLGNRVFTRQNLGEAFIKGIEAELSVPLFHHLLVYGNVNYTYGEHVNTGSPLSYIPPLHGKAGLRYQSGNGFWGKAEWFYAADQHELGTEDLRNPYIPNTGSPGWQVMNVFVGYDVGYDFGWCSASVGVLNMLNTSYRQHTSALDGYGRSVRASLRLRF